MGHQMQEDVFWKYMQGRGGQTQWTGLKLWLLCIPSGQQEKALQVYMRDGNVGAERASERARERWGVCGCGGRGEVGIVIWSHINITLCLLLVHCVLSILVDVLEETAGEAGIKSTTMKVSGEYAYQSLPLWYTLYIYILMAQDMGGLREKLVYIDL